jgi:hypothetical protein
MRIGNAPRAAASEHRKLMLQCNALPNQCSAGTTICPGSFSGIAVESNHWESLCPARTIRQRSGSDEVLRRDTEHNCSCRLRRPARLAICSASKSPTECRAKTTKPRLTPYVIAHQARWRRLPSKHPSPLATTPPRAVALPRCLCATDAGAAAAPKPAAVVEAVAEALAADVRNVLLPQVRTMYDHATVAHCGHRSVCGHGGAGWQPRLQH